MLDRGSAARWVEKVFKAVAPSCPVSSVARTMRLDAERVAGNLLLRAQHSQWYCGHRDTEADTTAAFFFSKISLILWKYRESATTSHDTHKLIKRGGSGNSGIASPNPCFFPSPRHNFQSSGIDIFCHRFIYRAKAVPVRSW
jgi:hypothetical protein